MATQISTVQKPAHPSWDIALTRMWQQVSIDVDACLRTLANRFEAVGLDCASRTHLGLRSMATVLSVGTPLNRLFELEYTLVDGMQASGLPGAVLVLRLLDADGQPVAAGSTGSRCTRSPYLDSAAQIVADCGDCLSPSWVLEVVSRHFDLLHRRRREPGQPALASAAARYRSPARFVSGPG